MDASPRVILVFSGKRKCGKDHITNLLINRLGEDCAVIFRLSAPLKEAYSEEHGLDFSRLLDASSYKEDARLDMITWGEEKRLKDPGYFCRLATSGPGKEKPVWIISDARRQTDLDYFQQNFTDITKLIRVHADIETRKDRGWVFTEGVDNVESECGLDEVSPWNHLIDNSAGQAHNLDSQLQLIIHDINKRIS